jgi:hypothetical protein
MHADRSATTPHPRVDIDAATEATRRRRRRCLIFSTNVLFFV